MYGLKRNGRYMEEKGRETCLWVEERELEACRSESGLYGLNSCLRTDARVSFGLNCSLYQPSLYIEDWLHSCMYCHVLSQTAST